MVEDEWIRKILNLCLCNDIFLIYDICFSRISKYQRKFIVKILDLDEENCEKLLAAIYKKKLWKEIIIVCKKFIIVFFLEDE